VGTTGTQRFGATLLLLGACFPAAAADPEFKAGGVALVLPGPSGDFVEVGDKLRTTFFELMAPASNRLLSAYVPSTSLTALNSGKVPAGLDIYAMVEVPRQAEYADVTPEAFAQVLQGMESSMGKLDAKTLENVEQELSVRLKSLGAGSVEIGRPEMLGGLFRKPDAASVAMLLAYKQGDRTVTMAGGIGFIRIRQRLIFAYLFRRYESPDTVSWLRKNLEPWVDAILAKNK
jgi:hypothetical protein